MQETVGGTCVKMPEWGETPSPRLVSEGLKHREGEGPPGRLVGGGQASSDESQWSVSWEPAGIDALGIYSEPASLNVNNQALLSEEGHSEPGKLWVPRWVGEQAGPNEARLTL